ncbi:MULTISPECIES: hypothetical protein [Bacillales]|uniref:hypothetical protein n=1 Tax=Bacillales TaxID=1385 RepID=UPI00187CEDDA|nr:MULTISPECIES: hypothetical protein [Bacillales]
MIRQHGDDETFCILALAFNEEFADEYKGGKLVLWVQIDDDLRYRVLNGEGTSIDAERLLRELEPELIGSESYHIDNYEKPSVFPRAVDGCYGSKTVIVIIQSVDTVPPLPSSAVIVMVKTSPTLTLLNSRTKYSE